ncbi:hypothetical protein ACIBG4_30755 [Nonomuraea sp. NPDC050383]|uniref:hypothetical protein n=1 Tax=Nonomuraea sp. NPDC050383 TaxID=3364362 RepID=UPI0037974C22
MTVRELRDVLREHGDATPPSNPVRHEQVRARISRIRLRRRLAAAGTTVAAVAALGLVLLPGGVTGGGPDTTTTAHPLVAPAAPAGLPESFTAPDGTVYRRLAATSIGRTGSRKTTITVPVTGRPLDVAGLCAGRTGISAGPRITVDGRPSGGGGGLFCTGQRNLVPLTVPAGAGSRITVTFDTTTHGSGCVRAGAKDPCVPVKEERVSWSLAVYEWTPPQTPAEPRPPRAFPREMQGWTLMDTRSGRWPGAGTATFRIRGDGHTYGIDQACTGDLAPRLWFGHAVDGRDSGSSSPCPLWEKGPFPMAMKMLNVPKGRTVTVTVKLTMRSPAAGRPVRWSVGLFRR